MGGKEDSGSSGRARVGEGDNHTLWGPEMMSHGRPVLSVPWEHGSWVVLPLRGDRGVTEASISCVLIMCEVLGKLPAVQSLRDARYRRVHFADQESGLAGEH